MFFLRLLRNKYVVTVTALAVWLLFFDRNDVFTQYELISKCRKLEREKQYYIGEIEQSKANLRELRENRKSLERLSREKYLMKKDDEDVFVIVAQ